MLTKGRKINLKNPESYEHAREKKISLEKYLPLNF